MLDQIDLYVYVPAGEGETSRISAFDHVHKQQVKKSFHLGSQIDCHHFQPCTAGESKPCKKTIHCCKAAYYTDPRKIRMESEVDDFPFDMEPDQHGTSSRSSSERHRRRALRVARAC